LRQVVGVGQAVLFGRGGHELEMTHGADRRAHLFPACGFLGPHRIEQARRQAVLPLKLGEQFLCHQRTV
jgi:hypothetical protein